MGIVGNTFNPNKFPTIRMPETPPTLKKELCDGIFVEYKLWDCPGQKALEHLPPLYITGCMAVLIVYDITDNVTFKTANDWMIYVRDECKGYDKVMVIGNKNDLMNKREVEYEDANNLCNEFGFNYLETSAKNGMNMDTLQKWLDSHTKNKVVQKRKECENEWQTERICLELNEHQMNKKVN